MKTRTQSPILCAENIRALTDLFGEQWAAEKVVPELRALKMNSNYLRRVTAVYGIEVLHQSAAVQKNLSLDCLVPLLMQMTSDPVPNVRLAAAKALGRIFVTLKNQASATWTKEVLGTLSRMAELDTDCDVRYFSGQVMLDKMWA